ncbi:cystinosin homolog isoform X2 [Pollicipes pollicipes]|uniref:cystinosin homolog isoform X2 n=1 Tax=Pollicipes pollicipes TaxID=41117 RepID=UPI001884B56E|nr:cystinosin homolog isoform X2 [Pollicipes pollicipes]XP_037077713.1 cystinosin homolog isoform X2 [Pollicipes pollicipes]
MNWKASRCEKKYLQSTPFKLAMDVKLKKAFCVTLCMAALFGPGLAASPHTPGAYTNGHDILLQISHNDSFKVLLSAPVPGNVTLTFQRSDTSVLEPIPPLLLPGNSADTATVPLVPKSRGHCTVTANASLPDDQFSASGVFVRVNVLETFGLDTFSSVVGWCYFVAWTISFYPQMYINWKRKSVVGLNFDFLALNLVGFTFYSVFNCGLYFSSGIQDMYYKDHPYGLVPVAVNDVVFALHALCACIITVLQCLIYERGDQRVSTAARGLLVIFAVVIIITAIITGCGVVNWLWFLYVFSYVKLAITIVKYVPQAYLNYRRRSTEGWAIGNVLLDFTGGSLSILQMFVDAYNYDDWTSIFGNPTKFGLGLFSVLFDVLFMCQHYCLYSSRRSELLDSERTGDSSAGGGTDFKLESDRRF